MVPDPIYPPVGFHFRVEFQDNPDLDGQEAYFQEVSGLSVEIEPMSWKVGGENRFEFRLPSRTKYQNLVLKRGLLKDSKLIDWVKESIETLEVTTATVLVVLLNENHEPLSTYRFIHAWPQKWSVTDFNAEENRLVIESIELAYQYFKIM
jgi:phage tail-like protein